MEIPLIALVRPPAPTFIDALSRHAGGDAIDYDRALAQHRAYVEALNSRGVEVQALDPLDAFPDSPFIEDNAIVLDGLALLSSMGADSRRGETLHTKPALERFLKVEVLEPPVYIDGGDVLQIGRTLFVGQSTRTNPPAVEAIARFTDRPVVPVTVQDGLHLKSAVSHLTDNLLLIDPERVDPTPFGAYEHIHVDPDERDAANCLTIDRTVLMPEGFPKTRGRIERRGLQVRELAMSEFQKADGGLTCLSLLIPKKLL